MGDEIRPGVDVIARLALQLKKKFSVEEIEEMTVDDMRVNLSELPDWAQEEMLKFYYQGASLDKEWHAWLVRRIERHDYSNLAFNAKLMLSELREKFPDYVYRGGF